MKKCLNCGTDFEDQVEQCPKCNAGAGDSSEWECLTTVGNDIEYEMVAGLLQMGNIPVIRKVKGVDGFIQILLGTPLKGIDMYVPKDRFNEAYELINTEITEESLEEQEKETEK